MRNLRGTRSLHQAGLTLVELMVAMVLGLLLTAAVIQVFAGSRSSNTVQGGMSRLQENARFALDALGRDIANAGFTRSFYRLADGSENARLTLGSTLNNVSAYAPLLFLPEAFTASDTIEVNYEAATDCLGAPTPNGVASNRYFLDGTDLMCLGNGAATPGLIAEHVENLQFLYGIDTDEDRAANSFVTADQLAADSVIVAVKVALLTSTGDPVGMDSEARYSLLDIPAVGPFSDRRLRQVFSRTIILRNNT